MNYDDWKGHWETLVGKFSNSGYQSLSSDERIWFNVRVLIDAVDGGGIISFYYNSGADYLDETIEDLRKIGAEEIVGLLSKINELFPEGKPSRNLEERNDIINTFDYEDGSIEVLFEDLDGQFYSFEEALELKLEPIIMKVMNG